MRTQLFMNPEANGSVFAAPSPALPAWGALSSVWRKLMIGAKEQVDVATLALLMQVSATAPPHTFSNTLNDCRRWIPPPSPRRDAGAVHVGQCCEMSVLRSAIASSALASTLAPHFIQPQVPYNQLLPLPFPPHITPPHTLPCHTPLRLPPEALNAPPARHLYTPNYRDKLTNCSPHLCPHPQ